MLRYAKICVDDDDNDNNSNNRTDHFTPCAIAQGKNAQIPRCVVS